MSFQKFSRNRPAVSRHKRRETKNYSRWTRQRKNKEKQNGYHQNAADFRLDDYKEDGIMDLRLGSGAFSYGHQDLDNVKRTFGGDKFDLYRHIKEVLAQTSTDDVPDLLEYLNDSKSLTKKFLSKTVKNQYIDFIAMSRNVLEIDDQMSELDDMLKSMSISLKDLHETKFEMLRRQKLKANPQIGRNEEEERDREKQEMEVLESRNEQILQHIQLRQLQQATDLIVDAQNDMATYKPAARKRAMNFINRHMLSLEALIVDQLSSSSYLAPLKRSKLSTLLMKLGFVDQAMELFLDHKSKHLKQEIRQISLYGNVKQYIQDLSKVFFDEIVHTTQQYTNLLNKIYIVDKQRKEQENVRQMEQFVERNRAVSTNPFDALRDDYKTSSSSSIVRKGVNYNHRDDDEEEEQQRRNQNSIHMSRLIVWIYEELEVYEKQFEKQVFQLEQNDFRTIGECLKVVFKQSTRLDHNGIHVSFLLSNHFQPSIEAAINRLYKKKLEAIKRLVRRENYVSKKKNVSNAANKRAARTVAAGLKFNAKKKLLPPASNPFTQTERKRSYARYARATRAKQQAMDPAEKRRSSEIFGHVLEAAENKDESEDHNVNDDDNKFESQRDSRQRPRAMKPDENMSELRRLTHKRRSMSKSDDVQLAMMGVGGRRRSGKPSGIGGDQKQQPLTVVKLTKSGQEMYEIVKKCIQETWRLLDQRYYSELTKSVYRTVVTQMIYLVQVYSSQITEEINNRAPKDLTTYRRSLRAGGGSSSSPRKGRRRSSGNLRGNKSGGKGGGPSPAGGVMTIMEDRQMGPDDEKQGDFDSSKLTKQSLLKPTVGGKKPRSHSAGRNSGPPPVLSEAQMLSLIANMYYVSEDLVNRIAHRYQKLFGRQIPELELFAIEQKKVYHAQFQQFGKKFLYFWVNDKLKWTDDAIHSRYAERADVSIVTREEIQEWSISPEMLGFVRYVVELKRDINLYLGEALEGVILRDAIQILLTELLHGDYIPRITEMGRNADQEETTVLISYHGLFRLHLDFRFMMVTLHKLMTPSAKNLCNSICEKARKYVNFKYNLKVAVDWKLMHAVAKKLSYKVLTGDELQMLDRLHPDPNAADHDNSSSSLPYITHHGSHRSSSGGGGSSYSGGTRRKAVSRSQRTENKNNPFNGM